MATVIMTERSLTTIASSSRKHNQLFWRLVSNNLTSLYFMTLFFRKTLQCVSCPALERCAITFEAKK